MIEMLSLRYRESDVLLGRPRLWGNIGLLSPTGLHCATHGVTLGMPGSGKSTAAAIPNVLTFFGSLLIFDPKGEIARAAYARRGKGGNGVYGLDDRVFVVDPTGMTGLPQARYNPLREIEREPDPARKIRLLFNLCEGLVKNPGGENAWCHTGARDVYVGFVAYVLTALPPEERTLLSVRRLLTQGNKARFEREEIRDPKAAARLTPFDAQLAEMLEAPISDFQHLIINTAATLKKMGDRQLGAIVTTAIEATTWLDLPDFQAATSDCDFSLSDFQTEKMSVFICLPLNELAGVAGAFMRMFVCMFTDMMYRAPAPPKHRVLMLIDEFPAFGYIDRFCTVAPQMRSYGVMLWILAQDMGQLKAIYPKEWETFIGCAQFLQVFTIKHRETVEYLVRMLGEKIVRTRTPEGRTVERPVPLLDAEQLMRQLEARFGNQIVWRGDRRPLLLKTIPYWWFLPYWMYSPDYRFKEWPLKAWLRARAARKAARKGGHP